jgi:hypothetical protein
VTKTTSEMGDKEKQEGKTKSQSVYGGTENAVR